MSTYLYLLRHGELVSKNVLAGHSDIALSEAGFEQLQQTESRLPTIDHLYSSPLQRCEKFAQYFSELQQVELTLEPKVKEMNFGDWDGVSYDKLWQKTEFTIGDFWQYPWQFSPPNGETMDEFTHRVDAWWQTWLTQKKQGNTLLVTHGGVIKHLLARITGLDITQAQHLNVFTIPYAGLIKISVFYDEEGKAWPSICF